MVRRAGCPVTAQATSRMFVSVTAKGLPCVGQAAGRSCLLLAKPGRGLAAGQCLVDAPRVARTVLVTILGKVRMPLHGRPASRSPAGRRRRHPRQPSPAPAPLPAPRRRPPRQQRPPRWEVRDGRPGPRPPSRPYRPAAPPQLRPSHVVERPSWYPLLSRQEAIGFMVVTVHRHGRSEEGSGQLAVLHGRLAALRTQGVEVDHEDVLWRVPASSRAQIVVAPSSSSPGSRRPGRRGRSRPGPVRRPSGTRHRDAQPRRPRPAWLPAGPGSLRDRVKDSVQATIATSSSPTAIHRT
jgi:hypothetical protein